MKLHHIKLLYFLLSVSLTSCKESADIPPFNFLCRMKLVTEDGRLPLKENKDKISKIMVNLIKPQDSDVQINDVFYLDYYDCLNIQIMDRKVSNSSNYEREYSIQVCYPEEIRKGKDTIKVKYQFDGSRPSIIEAFYNNEEPQYMGSDAIYFEVKN